VHIHVIIDYIFLRGADDFCRVYRRNPRRNLSRFGSLQITVGITMSTVQDFEIPRRLLFRFLVRLFATDDILFGLIGMNNRFVFD